MNTSPVVAQFTGIHATGGKLAQAAVAQIDQPAQAHHRKGTPLLLTMPIGILLTVGLGVGHLRRCAVFGTGTQATPVRLAWQLPVQLLVK
jgi:hypothetical protein